MMPKVTVGLPFYNSQTTLADAIRSVLNQTYTNLELLIVNDGSTDDSVRVLQSFDDPRLRIVDDGQNRGLAARLNHIAHLTETEFLFRMDADDIMHPDRIRVQVGRLQGADGPDLVSTAAWTIDGDNNILGIYRMDGSNLKSSMDVILRRGAVVHPTVAGRTEWFRNNPYGEDIRRSEDWELWLRSFDHTNYVHIAEPLLYYRQAETVSMRNYRIAKAEVRKHRARYGPALVGRSATFRLQALAVLQELVVVILDVLGRTDLIMGRRYREFSDEERSRAEQGLSVAISAVGQNT